MRKLKVHHEPLPGIGELFEIATTSGASVQVAAQRSGRRQLSVRAADADETTFSISLSRAEAAGLAALLVGAHIELITDQEG